MPINPSIFKRFLDLLLPLRCVKCGTVLENHQGLCTACWPLIPFIAKPYCACCGLPFPFEIEEGALCVMCSQTQPFYKTARSVFAYDSESKELILRFKHTDNTHCAPLFGEWMARLVKDIETPLCIPVPLHWTRLFMRTYNQAGLLAQEIAKQHTWRYAPSLLIRKRRTPSQGHLSKSQRAKNIEHAFAVPQHKKKELLGKTIVLVDDVLTTGITLNACSKTLLKAGAKEVHAITLGRVIKGGV
jgi:ComF family protein